MKEIMIVLTGLVLAGCVTDSRSVNENSFCGIAFGEDIGPDAQWNEERRELSKSMELREPFMSFGRKCRVFATPKTHKVYRVIMQYTNPPGCSHSAFYAYKTMLKELSEKYGAPMVEEVHNEESLAFGRGKAVFDFEKCKMTLWWKTPKHVYLYVEDKELAVRREKEAGE